MINGGLCSCVLQMTKRGKKEHCGQQVTDEVTTLQLQALVLNPERRQEQKKCRILISHLFREYRQFEK